MSQKVNKKWSVQEVELLIDSWRDHEVLYAVGTPNYHNKHLRKEALQAISTAVRGLKPDITEKDCSSKFHSLRSQFNIEHAKFKASLKSGNGADDVYTPSLWYYPRLLFLSDFYTPRSGRNSIEGTSADTAEENSQSQQVVAEVSADDRLNFFMEENIEPNEDDPITERPDSNAIPSTSASTSATTSAITSATPSAITSATPSATTQGNSQETPRRPQQPVRPQRPRSPVGSTSSGISTSSINKKRRPDDSFVEALNSVNASLTHPVVVQLSSPSQPQPKAIDAVDGFLSFLGSILRSIEDEETRLSVIQSLTQTVLNARTQEISYNKKN